MRLYARSALTDFQRAVVFAQRILECIPPKKNLKLSAGVLAAAPTGGEMRSSYLKRSPPLATLNRSRIRLFRQSCNRKL